MLERRVQICNSLNSTFTQTLKKSIQVLYRNFSRDNANVMVTFLPAQKQQDGHNCGLFSVAFATEVLDSKSLIDTVFHVPQLHDHLIYCTESEAFTSFPKKLNQKRKYRYRAILLAASTFGT